MGPLRIAYISYGLLTPTRAHNLQIVNTVNALIEHSAEVIFVNPILGEGEGGQRIQASRWTCEHGRLPERLNIPRSTNVLLPCSDLFSRYTRLAERGRYWALLVDRCVFGLRALSRVKRTSADVVVTRDLVTCWIFLLCKRVLGAPVVYEAHSLEQVMFDKEDREGEARSGERRNGPRRFQMSSDFAGHQNDDSIAGRCYKRALRRIENWTLRRASKVVTLTEAFAESLEHTLHIERPAVVCSGHDIIDAPTTNQCELRQRLDLPVDRRIAIYSGLSFNGKGVDLLFEVARHLPDDCSIVLLGGEPAGASERDALRREYDLGSRLILIPRVDHDQAVAYLSAADLGLLLYPKTEYFSCYSSPLKLFEYMACGVPVLATDLAALREIIVDGVNGILVTMTSPEAIASILAETLRDETKRQRLGHNALLDSKKFRYAERAARLIHVLRSCLQ